jgi:two-component system chemotaxis response regulator CheY
MRLDAMHTDPRPVLVVEDSADDFDTVLKAVALAKVRNRLIRAADAEVTQCLLANAPASSFAFMLLDYDLPGMDGLALLHHLRNASLLADLPVVVFTTSISPRDRAAFCAAGASAFHIKSVQHDECLRTIESIFALWLNQRALHDGPEILSRKRRAA